MRGNKMGFGQGLTQPAGMGPVQPPDQEHVLPVTGNPLEGGATAAMFPGIGQVDQGDGMRPKPKPMFGGAMKEMQ